MEQRLMAELTVPPPSSGIGSFEITSVKDCLESYKTFSCRYNFPSCDPVTGETDPICQTECQNFYTLCGMDIT